LAGVLVGDLGSLKFLHTEERFNPVKTQHWPILAEKNRPILTMTTEPDGAFHITFKGKVDPIF
jgi:hypothetical protein